MYSIEFDAKKVKDDLVEWIKDWFNKNGPMCNAVIGISGGKDSSVVAALCVEALGKERVLGVLMPNHTQEDIQYSKQLCKFLGIDNYTINVGPIIDKTMTMIEYGSDFTMSDQTKVNLPARIRMTVLYAVSQSRNGRVSNNCNLSEDWVGYATRYGDGAGDFSPLSKLTVTEVKAIGYELGLPKNLIEKVPTDGLCGKTDEDKFGFTYEVLDKYIREGVCEDQTIKDRIDYLHETNKFKLELIPCFEYNPN